MSSREAVNTNFLSHLDCWCGGTRLLPRDRGADEFHGDPIVGLHPRSGPEVKNGKSSAKDDVLDRLRCGIMSNVLPPYRSGAVPAPLPSGGTKWRDNISEGSGHLQSYRFGLTRRENHTHVYRLQGGRSNH